MAITDVVPLSALTTLLALVIAGGCGLLALIALLGPRGPVDTVRLHRDLEAQLLFAGAPPRPGLRERLHSRLRSHLNRAGLDGWPIRRFALASLLAALGGALLGWATLGAAPFVALGGAAGLAVPWLYVGRRAERRERMIAAQVVQLLVVVAGAASAAVPLPRILREVLPRTVQPPLADTLARAVRRLDPERGLATVGFQEVIAELDDRLENGPFSLARAAIDETVAEGVGLAASLEMIATLAREDLVFRGEVRAAFALVRGTAALVFAFPVVATLLLRLLAPDMVAESYSTPLGWAVAVLVGAASVGAYGLVTAGERRAARQAQMGWAPRRDERRVR
jgi:Flp pilus assembly protein TadB